MFRFNVGGHQWDERKHPRAAGGRFIDKPARYKAEDAIERAEKFYRKDLARRAAAKTVKISNRDDVPGVIRHEIDEAVDRALAAGARAPLRYVGAGMEGIVLADRHGNRAFKVARSDHGRIGMVDEMEWFRTAARVPGVREHLPTGVKWDATQGVLIKTFERGRIGNEYRDGQTLFDLHDKIWRLMEPHGWTAPERKAESYVMTKRGPVLIDAGMAIRIGKNIAKYALDVAEGRRKSTTPMNILASYVLREIKRPGNRHGTITADEAAPALAALAKVGVEWEM